MLCVHFCSALTHGWACSGPRPVHAQMPRTKILRTRLTLTSDGAEACDLDAPANTCAYDPEALRARFSTSPFEVAGRVLDIGVAAARIALAGDDGGATLRAELSALGPVFCKIGQTMATRPDIVGLATSRNLGQLQDAMAPEPDAKTAMATLRDSLGDKPVDSVLRGISPSPVAAASLAEVYRATAVGEDGQPVDVALKIQRPGLARKVGLDLFVIRGIIALLEGADIFDEGRVTIIDEVGSGIFDELDFRLEAAHIDRFKRIYARQLRRLGVEAPEVLDHLSSARVLVTAWVDGTPPRDLEPRRRQQFARTAVSCLTMQLMTEGFIHCDPHEGNWLVLPDDRIALLDFGLVAQMDRTHQESMAAGVLNVMAENYDALVPIFKGMGVLDANATDLRRPGVTEPFADALRRCMSGEDGVMDGAVPRRRKLVQDSDGSDRRKAFGQLYEELGELAFKYYFQIPPYYILVMRAFVTLEGIALSTNDTEFNMYQATAPYARRKLLTPATAGGRALLRAALTTSDGRRALRQGLKAARLPRLLPRARAWLSRARGGAALARGGAPARSLPPAPRGEPYA